MYMNMSKSPLPPYYEASNSDKPIPANILFNKVRQSDMIDEKIQENTGFSDKGLKVAMNDVFTNEPVGQVFFSRNNVNRVQKQIKRALEAQLKYEFAIEEEQDETDLLVAMRAVYMQFGRYRNEKIIHQVKQLNKLLLDYIIPDMVTMIKQEYGYIKEINEPLKPIARPVNVSNAGRRTLPSLTTIWNV